MSNSKKAEKHPKKGIASDKKENDGKLLSTERWVESTEPLSKESKHNKSSSDEKVKSHSVPKSDEMSSAKKIVNEQEQNNVVNSQEDNVEPDTEEQLNKNINKEDFPEAEDSTEQPFKKVPTMDA